MSSTSLPIVHDVMFVHVIATGLDVIVGATVWAFNFRLGGIMSADEV